MQEASGRDITSAGQGRLYVSFFTPYGTQQKKNKDIKFFIGSKQETQEYFSKQNFAGSVKIQDILEDPVRKAKQKAHQDWEEKYGKRKNKTAFWDQFVGKNLKEDKNLNDIFKNTFHFAVSEIFEAFEKKGWSEHENTTSSFDVEKSEDVIKGLLAELNNYRLPNKNNKNLKDISKARISDLQKLGLDAKTA